MDLKFLDPEITRKLLEGHEDVLSSAVAKREEFYAAQDCIQCGGNCRKIGDHNSQYNNKDILPHLLLECLACGCLFSPYSKLIVRSGNVAQAVEPAIPLINGTDD